jgi:hypothetical protein
LKEQVGENMEFYAVSCLVHKDICRAYDADEVPLVGLFQEGGTNPQLLRRLKVPEKNPEFILSYLFPEEESSNQRALEETEEDNNEGNEEIDNNSEDEKEQSGEEEGEEGDEGGNTDNEEANKDNEEANEENEGGNEDNEEGDEINEKGEDAEAVSAGEGDGTTYRPSKSI